ncbi:organomercurial lyase [Facklamia miroungae]|uniref:Alkylmercury lyase n=1 Tax=Facklamia miroungae TaxID=120956 RepID=A0A1G7U3L9_9LACT|nr:organomercurial lyase [Facklamia miroungae]NKZ29903.1 alkylmercury lyase [Facklamia miroungae]SDG42222.1 Alkylmercury lyase [Facklamia miroungae]
MNFTNTLTKEERKLRLEIINMICKNPDRRLFREPKYQPLIDKKVMVLEEDEVVTLYPLSLKKTNKKVYTQKSDKPVHAMCAIDALGLYHTIESQIMIEGEDEFTGEKIKLEMNNDKIINHNKQTVFILYKNVCKKKDCNKECCPFIHFFVSEDNIVRYLNKNCLKCSFQILDLDEANAVAQRLFISN